MNHHTITTVLRLFLFCLIPSWSLLDGMTDSMRDKPRVLVTSDGEIDDECSMVRFLLYANEWDVEGIVTSSSPAALQNDFAARADCYQRIIITVL